MRAQTPSAPTAPTAPLTAVDRKFLHPARPLLPPLTAVDRKFLQASNACPNPPPPPPPPLLPPLAANACPNPLRPHPPPLPTPPPSPPTRPPARPVLPPLTAVDRKFLQASNACPNPFPPHAPPHPTPHDPYCLHSLPHPAYRPPMPKPPPPLPSPPTPPPRTAPPFTAVHRKLPPLTALHRQFQSNSTLLVLISTAALQDWGSAPLLWPRLWAARAWRSRKGEAFMKNTPLPTTLLRCVAGVPLMLVMRALAGSPARRGNSKLAGEWLRNAHAFRVALGQVFGRCGAAPANSMMLLPPAAVTS